MSEFSSQANFQRRPYAVPALEESDGRDAVNQRRATVSPLPRLVIMDRRVFCNGASLDLARRPMMLKLFQMFCAAKGGRVDRDLLLRRIYGVRPQGDHSARFLDSMYQNGIKLISRTRVEAQATFGRTAGPGIEWMTFDHADRCWHLMTVREEVSQRSIS